MHSVLQFPSYLVNIVICKSDIRKTCNLVSFLPKQNVNGPVQMVPKTALFYVSQNLLIGQIFAFRGSILNTQKLSILAFSGEFLFAKNLGEKGQNWPRDNNFIIFLNEFVRFF